MTEQHGYRRWQVRGWRWLLALVWGLVVNTIAQAATVTDLAGRQVTVPERAERIVLGESRYIPALAILEGEQVLDRIVGMLPDFEQADPGSFQQYRERFPRIDDIPLIGHNSADSFSVERVIALGADLAIFSLEGHGPSARNRQLIDQLEGAGVAVVFIDFRQQPIANTPRSMALLGQLLGREAEAAAFNAFYQGELARVTEALATLEDAERPMVFLHSRVGLHDSCCETMASGMMGRFIDVAGGRNVATDYVPGVSGTMSLEFLITAQPEIYIGTAVGSRQGQEASDEPLPYVVLGAGVAPAMAQQSLARALQRPGLADLAAVSEGRAYAVWHHFYNTPLNVVAIQAMAKWLHPRRFADLNPRATLATLFRRFQPVALDGTYWIVAPEPVHE